jgi:hypothetical protein
VVAPLRHLEARRRLSALRGALSGSLEGRSPPNEMSALGDMLRAWWDSMHETQQQVDARRREDLLYYFQMATVK